MGQRFPGSEKFVAMYKYFIVLVLFLLLISAISYNFILGHSVSELFVPLFRQLHEVRHQILQLRLFEEQSIHNPGRASAAASMPVLSRMRGELEGLMNAPMVTGKDIDRHGEAYLIVASMLEDSSRLILLKDKSMADSTIAHPGDSLSTVSDLSERMLRNIRLLEEILYRRIDNAYRNYKWTQTLLIVVMIILLAAVIYAFLTWDRQRKQSHADLAAYNRQLVEATEKRERIEEILRQREELYRLMTENSSDIISLHDERGRFLYCSPSSLRLLGLEHEALTGTSFFQLVHTHDRQHVQTLMQSSVTTSDGAGVFQARIQNKSGDYLWFETRIRPVRDVEEMPRQFVAISRDITPQKLFETRLRESEERYRTLFEHAQVGIFRIASRSDELVECNGRMLEILERTREDIRQHGIMAWWQDRKQVASLFDKVAHGQSVIDRELALVTPGGSVKWVLMSIHWDRLEDVLEGFAIDITRRKEIQRELELKDQALSSALNGFCIASSSGIINYINPAFVRLWNIQDADSVNGLNLRDFIANPDRFDRKLTSVRQSGFWKGEISGKRADGSIFPLEMLAAVVSGGDETEHYLCVSFVDISERKKAMQRLLNTMEELKRSNEELERFAYVASHDLQEPLRKIQAFGTRVMSGLDGELDSKHVDFLARMISAGERMQSLINDLLQYSRLTTRAHEFEPVSLTDTLQQVVSDLDVLLNEDGGRIEVGHLPSIEADPTQMYQLFKNLLTNGLKFRKPDVEPIVKVYSEAVESGFCHLTVGDNGIGFEPEFKEKIFVIFQRLHNRTAYPGTGIGLAICRKIVERHGGQIFADGNPGKGAVFHIVLPMKQEGE